MGCTLGIIDEDPKQRKKIRRTIKANIPTGIDEPKFKDYLEQEADVVSLESLMEEIKADISNHDIDGLIIDYKLVMPSMDLHGSDIYERLDELVPKLPIILLTNYPDPCHELPFVDADKIYPKNDFFKLESSFSKEKVRDILENIGKYSSQRLNLQQSFENEMNQFQNRSDDFELYSRAMTAEDKLAKYSLRSPSLSTRGVSIESLREAVELIDEAYAIMREQDEQKDETV